MKLINQELIRCACGCGQEIIKFDKYGRKRGYIIGHNRRGHTKMFLTKKELENLYINRELSTISIGKRIGLSQQLVYSWLKKYRIKTRNLSKIRPKNELIECACGCGQKLWKYDKQWIGRRYIVGHNTRDKKPLIDKKELEELYINKKQSATVISNWLGCSPTTAYHYLKKNSIRIRSLSEAHLKPKPQNELIKCICGCGKEFQRFDKYGRERRYIFRHCKILRKMFLTKKKLEDLYINQRLSMDTIAKKLNLGATTIHRWLIKYDIKIRVLPKIPYRQNELIECACGCGQKRWKYDEDGIERKYIQYHISKLDGFNKGRIPWNKGKTSKWLLEYNKSRKGKTYEELYGKEKAKILREMTIKRTKGKSYEEQYGVGKAKLIRIKHSKKLKDKSYEELHGIERAKLIKNKLREQRNKQIFPKKDTKIEIKIQMFLKELGYEYFTHQYMKNIKHGYQCDILIPALNLVIECDGDYWHKYPIGTDLDHIRTKELLEKGFKVLRLWECEIKMMDIGKFKEDIGIIKMEVIK